MAAIMNIESRFAHITTVVTNAKRLIRERPDHAALHQRCITTVANLLKAEPFPEEYRGDPDVQARYVRGLLGLESDHHYWLECYNDDAVYIRSSDDFDIYQNDMLGEDFGYDIYCMLGECGSDGCDLCGSQ